MDCLPDALLQPAQPSPAPRGPHADPKGAVGNANQGPNRWSILSRLIDAWFEKIVFVEIPFCQSAIAPNPESPPGILNDSTAIIRRDSVFSAIATHSRSDYEAKRRSSTAG